MCRVPFTQHPTVSHFSLRGHWPHFTDEETESQRQQVAKWGFRPRAPVLSPGLHLSLRPRGILDHDGQAWSFCSLP